MEFCNANEIGAAKEGSIDGPINLTMKEEVEAAETARRIRLSLVNLVMKCCIGANTLCSWSWVLALVQNPRVCKATMEPFKKFFCGSSWETIAAHKKARSMHAAVLANGSMFIAGGCHEEKYMSDVLELNLKTLKWSEREPLPVSSAGFCLIARESSIFAFVGIPAEKDLRVYEMASSSWSLVVTHGQSPVATVGHSASADGNTVLVFGGKDFRGHTNSDLHIFDLDAKRWERVNASGTIPPPLSFHGAAVHGDYLLVFGGYKSCGSVSDDMFSFHLRTKQWATCKQGGVLPRAGFGCASSKNCCYIVGGGIPQTLELKSSGAGTSGSTSATQEFCWQVVIIDPDMQHQGLSLVLHGPSALIAAGTDSEANEFRVFQMNMNGRPSNSAVKRPEKALHCRVMRANGTYLQKFHLLEQGKQVAEILEVIQMQSKAKGYLTRGGFGLTRSDLVVPGDELVFHEHRDLRRRQHLSLMDISDCRTFLARMGINLVSGVGWLTPTKEVDAKAFDWNRTVSVTLQDQLEYLKQHMGGTIVDRDYSFNQSCEVRSSRASYSLKFEVQLQLDIMYRKTAAVGFRVEETIDEEIWWRAMVTLLGLTIKCPEARPWMVVSDLKDEWYFAWMDGKSMFCSRSRSRREALGIVRDLVRDYDKVTVRHVAGPLSKLPSGLSMYHAIVATRGRFCSRRWQTVTG